MWPKCKYCNSSIGNNHEYNCPKRYEERQNKRNSDLEKRIDKLSKALEANKGLERRVLELENKLGLLIELYKGK